METLPRNSIPVSLQSLMADLDFLSQIKRNMKPCCNDRVLVDSDSWTGAFYRFFKGENRINVITKVEQIVHNAIEAIENEKYREHISLTVNSLYSALSGILNLVYTYENDPNMKARLNVQIKNINIQLDRYRHFIKGLNEIPTPSINLEENGNNPSLPDTIDLLDSSSLDFDKKKLKRNFKKEK
jgi:hypothetical protein